MKYAFSLTLLWLALSANGRAQETKLASRLAEEAAVGDIRTRSLLATLSSRALESDSSGQESQTALQLRVWDAAIAKGGDLGLVDGHEGLDGSRPEAKLRRALMLATKDPEQGIALAQSAIESGVNTPYANYVLAATCFFAGELDKAIAACDGGIEQFGQLSVFYQIKSVALFGKNRFPEAEECAIAGLSSCRSTYRDVEDYSTLLNLLVTLQFEQGEFDKALGTLKRLRQEKQKYRFNDAMEWVCHAELGRSSAALAMTEGPDSNGKRVCTHLQVGWSRGYVPMRRGLEESSVDAESKLLLDYTVALADAPQRDKWMKGFIRQRKPLTEEECIIFALALSCIGNPSTEDLKLAQEHCEVVATSPRNRPFLKLKAQMILVASQINGADFVAAQRSFATLRMMLKHSTAEYRGVEILERALEEKKQVVLGHTRRSRRWLMMLPTPPAVLLLDGAIAVD